MGTLFLPPEIGQRRDVMRDFGLVDPPPQECRWCEHERHRGECGYFDGITACECKGTAWERGTR